MKIKASVLLTLLAVGLTACSVLTPQATPTPDEPWLYWTPAGPVKIEPEIMPPAKLGEMYEVEIRVSENQTPAADIVISSGSLPAGLAFAKVEGEDIAKISGIPQEAGAYTFTVTVWCYGTMVSGQTGEQEYRIVVEP